KNRLLRQRMTTPRSRSQFIRKVKKENCHQFSFPQHTLLANHGCKKKTQLCRFNNLNNNFSPTFQTQAIPDPNRPKTQAVALTNDHVSFKSAIYSKG
ncbi:MAG: hypothetical protein ACTH5B_16560, partial [Marinomonas sp.]|uniref:hypothetical protein n=1 Tax=Marinomonas sp. TaxID=1904862 RepID=UPI003F98A200